MVLQTGQTIERSQYKEKANVCSGKKMLVATLQQKHVFIEWKVSFGDMLWQMKQKAIFTRRNIYIKNNLIRYCAAWLAGEQAQCMQNNLKEPFLKNPAWRNWRDQTECYPERRKRWGRGGAPLWLIAGGGTFTTLPTRMSLKSPIFLHPKTATIFRKRWGRVWSPLWLIAGGGAFNTLSTWWPWSFITSKPVALLTVCI